MLGLLAWPVLAPAADVETRVFQVSVDNKPAGEAQMTFSRHDNGTVTMSCDTDIVVKILFVTYKYSYRGREVWKDGRLQRFDSTCNDDGTRFTVVATPHKDTVRVRIKEVGRRGEEKVAEKTLPGNVWLSSYWWQPDNNLVNRVVPIMDADSGKELSATIQFIGVEERAVAGEVQKVNHFRLVGTASADLWYDATGRLVCQEWMEQKHKTQLELVRVRR